MNKYSMSRLTDQVLLNNCAANVSRDRGTTAMLLAELGEIESRRLYVPAGYASMHLFCIEVFRFSEDETYKRIRVARLAHEFPAILPAIEDARLNMSTVLMLSTHLSPETAEELLTAAANKSKAGIGLLLAQRFPKPDLETLIQPIAQVRTEAPVLAPPAVPSPCQLAPERVGMTKPQQVEVSMPRARLAPLSPERFALQVTIGQGAHDKLRYAQALLGHAVPSGDVAQVLERALDALIHKLEQRKFAATSRSRPARRLGETRERRIPAAVRREVWERDGGKCTFVSDNGHHCEARVRLEYDHIQPIARGGLSTAANLRLRCRAHNQLEAEKAFGSRFMRGKREAAKPAVPRQAVGAQAGPARSTGESAGDGTLGQGRGDGSRASTGHAGAPAAHTRRDTFDRENGNASTP